MTAAVIDDVLRAPPAFSRSAVERMFIREVLLHPEWYSGGSFHFLTGRSFANDLHGFAYDMLTGLIRNMCSHDAGRLAEEIARQKRPDWPEPARWLADLVEEPPLTVTLRDLEPLGHFLAAQSYGEPSLAKEFFTTDGDGQQSTHARKGSDLGVAVRTVLYWHYDGDDLLLYIGISDKPGSRTKDHAAESSWSEFAVRMEARWFPNRPAAATAEVAAIKAERPLFNRQHNDTPEARARLVAYLVEKGRLDLLAPAVSRG